MVSRSVNSPVLNIHRAHTSSTLPFQRTGPPVECHYEVLKIIYEIGWVISSLYLSRCSRRSWLSQILPMYANTHSEESFSGRQMNALSEPNRSTGWRLYSSWYFLPTLLAGDEARSIIKSACGADESKDVCLFVGSGSTGAILKLVDVLGVSSTVRFVNVVRTSRGVVANRVSHLTRSSYLLLQNTRSREIRCQ